MNYINSIFQWIFIWVFKGQKSEMKNSIIRKGQKEKVNNQFLAEEELQSCPASMMMFFLTLLKNLRDLKVPYLAEMATGS